VTTDLNQPWVVSRPYRLARWEIIAATVRWWQVLVFLPTGIIVVAFGGPPILAVLIPALWTVAFAGLTFATVAKSALEERTIAVCADGRFRVATRDSAFDGHLGRLIDARSTRRGWTLRLAKNLVIVVPSRAFDPDAAAGLSHLIDQPRVVGGAGPTYSVYSADPMSTLPFDSKLGPQLRWALRKTAPRAAVLAGVVIVYLFLVGTTVDARPTLFMVVAMLALLMLTIGVTVVVKVALGVRSPDHRGQRVAVTPAGLETFGRFGSSTIRAADITKVVSHSNHLIAFVPNPLIIPDTAFRDRAHRDQFAAALRWLADQAASAASTAAANRPGSSTIG
jgi:hypothetical protein